MEAAKLALALKVMTYNVAGIPVIHPDVSARLSAIGPELGKQDIIAIQETWFDGDSEKLWKLSGLPDYARYQRAISLGSGLAIISRWPIIEKRQMVFTCRPSALRVYEGEWPANKGAMMVRIQTPKGRLDVYNTHIVSNYGDRAPYRSLRLSQIYDVAAFIRANSADTPFILLGDFNTGPGERAYGLIKDLLGLRDLCPKDGCGIDHIMIPKGRLRASAANLYAEKGWSDHPAVAGELDWDVLKLRLKPDRRDRAGALEDVETAMQNMIDIMARRRRARAWIPVYGFLMGLRYDHQTQLLAYVRDRAASERLRGD